MGNTIRNSEVGNKRDLLKLKKSRTEDTTHQGFKPIDANDPSGGLKKGTMSIVMARSGTGKSSLGDKLSPSSTAALLKSVERQPWFKLVFDLNSRGGIIKRTLLIQAVDADEALSIATRVFLPYKSEIAGTPSIEGPLSKCAILYERGLLRAQQEAGAQQHVLPAESSSKEQSAGDC